MLIAFIRYTRLIENQQKNIALKYNISRKYICWFSVSTFELVVVVDMTLRWQITNRICESKAMVPWMPPILTSILFFEHILCLVTSSRSSCVCLLKIAITTAIPIRMWYNKLTLFAHSFIHWLWFVRQIYSLLSWLQLPIQLQSHLALCASIVQSIFYWHLIAIKPKHIYRICRERHEWA